MSSTDAPAILETNDLRTIHFLLKQGGSYTDEQGLVTRKFFEQNPELEVNGHPSQQLKALENYGLLTREMRGKRTYAIELTDQGMTAAQQYAALLEEQGVELSTISSDQLIGEVLNRLHQAADPDHDECLTTQAELIEANTEVKDALEVANQRFDAIHTAMKRLANGETSWLVTAQVIFDNLPEEAEQTQD